MNDLQVSTFMRSKSLFFKKEMAIETAVEKLLTSHYLGGPVIDDHGLVIGWLSEQDCLAKMIEASYYCELAALVEDVMVKTVLSVKGSMSVFDLAQQMCVTSPKIYPVVDNENRYIGLISRKDVLSAMYKQLESC
ncbi:CBS domain-containing protein [Psychromonas antarctica]|jgi:predicted transcriptional regulator|uniref:CBS domain-containing protein n=1 Tax=Psychromonas antarctica TaxID=67573 RepID=UPI001EE98ED0|nr:CBS domain-containing protein [Psychromonas antarctica]MCG6201328.1 CBS domain-containing protein [Psychromonas antarctica]